MNDGRYAFADYLKPLVVVCAPDYGRFAPMVGGLRKQFCTVEEVSDSNEFANVLGSKRPSVAIFGAWSTKDVVGLATAKACRELCRSLACSCFFIYDSGMDGAVERVLPLEPDDFLECREPVDILLYRLQMCVESRRGQNRLRLLKRASESVDTGILIVDATAKELPIIFANPGFERITGYTAKEILGKNCRFLQGNERNQPALDTLRAAIRKGESCTVVLKNYRKDNTLFWNRLQISPYYDDSGMLTHFVGVQTDITIEMASKEVLKESEERFRTIADVAPVMMWMVSQTHEWTFLNKAWLEFLDLEEEQQKKWMELIHPRDKPGFLNLLEAAFRQPKAFRWEGEIQAGGGHYRPIVLSGVARFDKGGAFIGFIGSAIDVTDKRNFERALARRQRGLAAQGLMQRKLLAGAPGGKAELEVLSILVEVADVSSASLWKLEKIEPNDTHVRFSELSTTHRSKSMMRLDQEASSFWSNLKGGETVSLGTGEMIGSEHRFFSERSSAFVVLAPIFVRGELRGVLVLESTDPDFRWDVIHSDLVNAAVTAFAVSQTQMDVEQEVARLAAFPKLSPNPFIVLTRDGKSISENVASREFARQFNLGRIEQLLPLNYAEVIENCLENNKSRQAVMVLGKDVRLSWTFVPLPEEEIVLAYGADLSYLVQLEQRLIQSEKMQALGELTSSIGYEFNTLLSTIQGAVDLISLQPGHPPQLLDQIRQISWEAEKGGTLAKHLFLYGKAGSIQRSVLDLNSVVAGMSDMLDRILGSSLQRKLDLEHGLPPVIGDRAMLEQAIYNLVLNAREASKPGDVIEVSTHYVSTEETVAEMGRPNPDGYVRLSIVDSGVGMTMEETTRIFDPLYTTKAAKEHSGLGLFVVYSIVKEHEGWIELSTAPGAGTTFEIFIPAAPRSDDMPDNFDESLDDRTGTILLVEDNVLIAKNTAQLLENHGHIVMLAHSSEEAMQQWDSNQADIDLVICDVLIDHMSNGPELAKIFREQKSSVKIVFMSGYSKEFAIQTLNVPPESQFLSKPFTNAELISTIQLGLSK